MPNARASRGGPPISAIRGRLDLPPLHPRPARSPAGVRNLSAEAVRYVVRYNMATQERVETYR